ncbi:serine/arginine repetitive matrix protein 2-like isoform X1 [Amphibalanus amphitrite]|uniref:serine/arginine repetitive matrix protein 2-like isoform X1 n=1 Tax=Amphibalanus amphitrite TaxID=1232801 RepID=UPI001C91CECA|nr:serine/arginine repetitive matrix protein 2-like isoform X1 [Amphibalanus amphitrite]
MDEKSTSEDEPVLLTLELVLLDLTWIRLPKTVIEDISNFTKAGCTDWPTVSAQRGQAYLRNTRGKRVALVNFALRLSCLSDCGGGGAAPGATGEPAAAAAPWPQWNHPLADDATTVGGKAAAVESRESLESTREVRVSRRPERDALSEAAQEVRAVRLDRPPPRTGLPGNRHVAWGLQSQQPQQEHNHLQQHHQQPQPHQQQQLYQQHQQQQQQSWASRPDASRQGRPALFEHTRLEDVDECAPAAPPPPPPVGRPWGGRQGTVPAAARSRSSSAERGPDPTGGSCWRAPLETDEGSLASDASSGPIVTRLIQELAAMQRTGAESKHVAVQTRPLRELLEMRGPPPPAPIRLRGRRRPRPPRIRRLPLISEEPVTEGFARRRPAAAGLVHRPPPPDTTVVDRLSRGQPVTERRAVGGRLRAPPPRLRPVTLTRTAQLRLAKHMADVRHDLHAQEYGRRRDRWLAEQRRKMGRTRPPPPPPEALSPPREMSPHSARSGPARKRRARPGVPHPRVITAMKSIGVQFESEGSPPPAEGRSKSTKTAVTAKKGRAPSPTPFVEPRSSQPSRSTESRPVVIDFKSPPDQSTVKTPSEGRYSTGAMSNHDEAAELLGLSRADAGPRGARRSQSATASRSQGDPGSQSGSAVRSRSETVAGLSESPVVTPPRSAERSKPSPTLIDSESGQRRLHSASSKERQASEGGKTGASATKSGNSSRSSSSSSRGSGSHGRKKSPSVIADSGAAPQGPAGGSSGGESLSSSTLRTERHVSEEMVSVPHRSPPSAAASVKTESAPVTASRRTSSSTTTATGSVAPTRSDSASQVGAEGTSATRTSSTSSSESSEDSSDSSESSSSETETSQSQTRTQTSATQTGSSVGRAPTPARRGGRSPAKPTAGAKSPTKPTAGARSPAKPAAGARPKPAPRGPPTWQRVEDSPAVSTGSFGPTGKAAVASSEQAGKAAAGSSKPGAASRSRCSSSCDSAEIDARIAMFLKQSGDKKEKEEQERRKEQEQKTVAAAPPGAGWLKGSSPSLGGVGAGAGSGGLGAGSSALGAGSGGGTSWLKAWRVDEDITTPAVGRRPSRGRHTLPQPAAGLNTDSVSSYAPSDLGGGTLSDLTPP